MNDQSVIFDKKSESIKKDFKFKNTNNILGIMSELKDLNNSFVSFIDEKSIFQKLKSSQNKSKYKRLSNQNPISKSLNFSSINNNKQEIEYSKNKLKSNKILLKDNLTHIDHFSTPRKNKISIEEQKSPESKHNLQQTLLERKNPSLDRDVKIKINYNHKTKNANDNRIDHQISNYVQKNKYLVDKFIESKWTKFCFQDKARDSCSLMSKQSLYLQLCKWQHPNTVHQIIKCMKVGVYTKKENQLHIINRVANWKQDEIMTFCFNIQNPNHIGAIDCNDMMIMLKSSQCKSVNNYQNEDIKKMIEQITNLKTKSDDDHKSSGLQVLQHINKVVTKDLANYKSDKKANVTDLIEAISKINIANSKQSNKIEQEEFKLLNWDKIPNTTYSVPSVYQTFMKVIIGLDLKFEMKNNVEIVSQISPKYHHLESSWHDFETLCEKLELNATICVINQHDIKIIEKHPRNLHIIESFQNFTDKTNRINQESLLSKFEYQIGLHGIEKLTMLLFELISNGYPVNLYKFIHFIAENRNKGLNLLWHLLCMNKDSISTWNIDFQRETFRAFPILHRDLDTLLEQMNFLKINKIESQKQLEQLLSMFSQIQNFIWMILQGDPDQLEYGKQESSTLFQKYKCSNVMNFSVNKQLDKVTL